MTPELVAVAITRPWPAHRVIHDRQQLGREGVQVDLIA
jgi:hypothetical protein